MGECLHGSRLQFRIAPQHFLVAGSQGEVREPFDEIGQQAFPIFPGKLVGLLAKGC